MARERYTYQNGRFLTTEGEPIALADIPGHVAVSFPETSQYIGAQRLQNPRLFDSLIEGCRDADVKAYFEAERAFVTDLLERNVC